MYTLCITCISSFLRSSTQLLLMAGTQTSISVIFVVIFLTILKFSPRLCLKEWVFLMFAWMNTYKCQNVDNYNIHISIKMDRKSVSIQP